MECAKCGQWSIDIIVTVTLSPHGEVKSIDHESAYCRNVLLCVTRRLLAIGDYYGLP